MEMINSTVKAVEQNGARMQAATLWSTQWFKPQRPVSILL